MPRLNRCILFYCLWRLPITPCVIIYNMCQRKKIVSLIQDPRRLQYTHSSVQSLNPFLFVCTFNFGFVQAHMKLYRLLFAHIFLPLVTVVYPGTAQQTRQLMRGLHIIFNQLCYGTELSLAFLQMRWRSKKRYYKTTQYIIIKTYVYVIPLKKY